MQMSSNTALLLSILCCVCLSWCPKMLCVKRMCTGWLQAPRFYLGAEWQKEEIQIQFSLLHGKLQNWSNSAAEFMKNRVLLLLRAGQALLPLVLLSVLLLMCSLCVGVLVCKLRKAASGAVTDSSW